MTNMRHGTALQLEMSAQDKISQNSEHSASQPQWALICMPITFYSSQLEEIRWKVQPEAKYWTRFCWTMVRLFHPEDIFCVRDEWLVWTRRFCETLSASATAQLFPGLKSSSLTSSISNWSSCNWHQWWQLNSVWLPILIKSKDTPWFLSIETKCQVLFSRAAGLVRPQIECLPASPGCVAQR